MSQIQGVNSAQYSMPWLFGLQQTGAPTSASAPPAQANDPGAAPFDPFSAMLAPGLQQGNTGAAQPFSLDAMSALISAQEQSSGPNGLSPDQQKVFSELDTDGDGKVTTSELETDFGADDKDLADAVMNKLDTNGDGSIDAGEFQSGTKKTLHQHHAHHGGAPKGGLDALMSAATQGETSQTLTNSDGSTTTTLTYADGSKVTLTSPAASTSADNSANADTTQAKAQSNLLEQLIKLQAQLTASATSSLTATTV
jgi:hypothetical protein